jgi:hypothetical protein
MMNNWGDMFPDEDDSIGTLVSYEDLVEHEEQEERRHTESDSEDQHSVSTSSDVFDQEVDEVGISQNIADIGKYTPNVSIELSRLLRDSEPGDVCYLNANECTLSSNLNNTDHDTYYSTGFLGNSNYVAPLHYFKCCSWSSSQKNCC